LFYRPTHVDESTGAGDWGGLKLAFVLSKNFDLKQIDTNCILHCETLCGIAGALIFAMHHWVLLRRGVFHIVGNGSRRGLFALSVFSACASAGFMCDVFFIFFDQGGLLAHWFSCCMREREFDVGFTFYFR
jgi:hypothetical protein